MFARKLLSFALLMLLTTACSSTPASTGAATDATSGLEVLQPSPGVDVTVYSDIDETRPVPDKQLTLDEAT